MFYSDDPVRDYDRFCEWNESKPQYDSDDLYRCQRDIEELESDIEYYEEQNDQEEVIKLNEKLDNLYELEETIEKELNKWD